uniref:Uncharacterized protein n=1 Tax=Anguilla anguilla TaxID=7936 RepID=A0A0E9WGI3_ANGAN
MDCATHWAPTKIVFNHIGLFGWAPFTVGTQPPSSQGDFGVASRTITTTQDPGNEKLHCSRTAAVLPQNKN